MSEHHHPVSNHEGKAPGDYWFLGQGWPRKVACTIDESGRLRFSQTTTPVCVDCLIPGEFTDRDDRLPLPEKSPF